MIVLCPHCGKQIELFKVGGGERLADEMGVPFLGRIPIDLQIVISGDSGKSFMQHYAKSQAAKAFGIIIKPFLA